MNIELANRLYEYRKQSGLSQEELAEKLGISRQSVSKWERAESCPDTDNLIELSKIYNVTMDELLNTSKDIKNIKEEKTEEVKEEKPYKVIVNLEDNVFEDNFDNTLFLDKDGIHIEYAKEGKKEVLPYEYLYTEVDGKETKIVDIDGFGKTKEQSPKLCKIKDVFNGTLILVIAALYLALCGLEVMEWGKFWVIFVYYPFICSVLEAIVNKDANNIATPVLCAAVYVTIGMYLGSWHPYWFIFFLVPIYHTIVSAFKKKIVVYFYDEANEKHSFAIKPNTLKVVSLNKKEQPLQ